MVAAEGGSYAFGMYHGEKFNSISHLIGGLLALAGIALLNAAALRVGSPWLLVGCLIYSAAIILMFAISTLYHSTKGPKKALLRKLDHIAIFVMIAGTFTPFCLGPLREGVGVVLLAAVWALALVGGILDFWLAHRTRVPSFILYFVMAFLAVAAFPGLEKTLPLSALAWIKGGDYLFALGFVFYLFDKKFRGQHLHGVWHLFVIAGAFCQFVSVFGYLV